MQLALAARLLAEHEDAAPHDGGAGDGGDGASPGRVGSHAPSSLPAGGWPPRAALSRQSSAKAWQPLDVLGTSGSDAGRLPVSATPSASPTEGPSLKADLDADAALGKLRTELAAALARVGGLEEELAAARSARDDGRARLAVTAATATQFAAAETPEMPDAAVLSPLSAGRSIEFFTPDNSESCARSPGFGHSDAAGDCP
jgi:hypothetical protein